MPTVTYRDHVDLFNKYKSASLPYAKILSVLALALTLSLVASSRLISLNNKQVTPVNRQTVYFQSASNAFYKSKQSLNELRSSLQVAGVKTQTVDSLTEASASSRVPGFFIALGDIQKTIDRIKVTRENIQNEKKNFEVVEGEDIYGPLTAQIQEYFNESETFLVKMETSQIALKELTRAATPAFFLPTLSDEEVWERGNISEISAYYEGRKAEAQEAQDSYSKINTTIELSTYKDLQLSHFLLVVNVSDNIISVLSRPIQEDEQEKLKLKEEAYQVLVGAKRENEQLAEQLLDERIKLSSLTNYSDELSALANRERIIESGLVEGNDLRLLNQQKSEEKNSLLKILDFKGFTK